jgi:hypothetical protein
MAAPAGNFVGLNLGPLGTAAGGFVGLNLGVEWDDTPVEPVIRGIRYAAGLSWGGVSRARWIARIQWDSSVALRETTSSGWGLAAAVWPRPRPCVGEACRLRGPSWMQCGGPPWPTRVLPRGSNGPAARRRVAGYRSTGGEHSRSDARKPIFGGGTLAHLAGRPCCPGVQQSPCLG